MFGTLFIMIWTLPPQLNINDVCLPRRGWWQKASSGAGNGPLVARNLLESAEYFEWWNTARGASPSHDCHMDSTTFASLYYLYASSYLANIDQLSACLHVSHVISPEDIVIWIRGDVIQVDFLPQCHVLRAVHFKLRRCRANVAKYRPSCFRSLVDLVLIILRMLHTISTHLFFMGSHRTSSINYL